MSKKSRRRNRRLLMMAALAGGAALAGRGKGMSGKETISDAQKAHNFASDAAVTDVVNPNLNKSVVSDGPVLNVTGGIHADKPAKGMLIKARNKNRVTGVDGPPGILNPYNPRGMNHPLAKGRLFRKKGGSVKKARVTGIAKRGFGRALMKGKK